jgi:hypothetical protein
MIGGASANFWGRALSLDCRCWRVFVEKIAADTLPSLDAAFSDGLRCHFPDLPSPSPTAQNQDSKVGSLMNQLPFKGTPEARILDFQPCNFISQLMKLQG